MCRKSRTRWNICLGFKVVVNAILCSNSKTWCQLCPFQVQEGCQQVSSSLDGLPTFMRTLRRSPAARLWKFGILATRRRSNTVNVSKVISKSFPSHSKPICVFDKCINCVKAVPLSGHHSCTFGLELGTCWLLVVLGHEARGAIRTIRAIDFNKHHL